MYPILLHIGPFTVSSFGVFLALSLGAGSFVVWRLAQVYDLDREKIIDLSLLSFIAGLLGARIFFIIFNFSQVNSFEKIFFINKYPGFYFWGGILTGLLTLLFFSRRFKFNFWLICDFAIVGLFAAASLGSLGCIFSGCMYGLPSNLPLSLSIVGVIGERFPVQTLFALSYLIFFIILWKKALRFHFQGAVASLGLIFLGLINLILGFLRSDQEKMFLGLSLNIYFSLASIVFGIRLYYLLSKRGFRKEALNIKNILVDKLARERYLLKLKRSWYNSLVQFRVNISKGFKKTKKRLNVKENPREF